MLDKDEIKSSNFVGISFCLFVAGLIAYFVTKNESFLSVAGFGFIMMVPLGRMFDSSKYKNAPLYFSMVMGSIGLLAIYTTFMDNQLYNGFTIIFILCFVAYQWLANYWSIKRNNI